MATMTGVTPVPPPPRLRGSRGDWLLGAGLDLRRDALGTYARAQAEHGDVVRLRLGPARGGILVHAVMHPALAHEVLTDRESFSKQCRILDEVRWMIGGGLLTAGTTQWLQQKRVVQPVFAPHRLAELAPAVHRAAGAAIGRFGAAADRGGCVDAYPEMTTTALDIAAEVVLGGPLGGTEGLLRAYVDVFGERVFRRSTAPLRLPPEPALGVGRREVRRRAEMMAALDELVVRRRAELGTGVEGGTSLLDLLLTARTPEGAPLGDAEVRDQVLVFLAAGHETTATALTYALHLLARHPDVADRVAREASAVDAATAPGDLPYTERVVKEVLRLYPSAYGIPRSTTRAVTVGGHPVPARSLVMVSTWVIQRDARWWPDPTRLDPDRHLPDLAAQRPRHAWMPFGAGPRACIGGGLAMLEATLVLAHLLSRFELQAIEATPPPPVPRVALRPGGPVPLRVRRRAR